MHEMNDACLCSCKCNAIKELNTWGVTPLTIVPMGQRDHVKISKYEPNHGEQEVQVLVAEESCWLQTQNWRAFVCSRINRHTDIGSEFP
jgi:hypothetical protein